MRLVNYTKLLLTVGCALALNYLPAQVNAVLSNPSACGLALPLTDYNCPDDLPFFSPDQFQIDVTTAPGILGIDVFLKEVRILISHTWDSDLDLVLYAPSGKAVLLTADNGGGEDNYGDPSDLTCGTPTIFTTQACIDISEGEAPFTASSYLPEESLFLFNDSLTIANGAWILEVCDDSDEDSGTLEYVELVFEPVSCTPVHDITVLNIDSTTAVLDWMPDSFCGVSVVEFGPPGFTPGVDSLAGGGTVVYGACPPFVLAGMPDRSTVDIYVRKYCPTSGFSENSCAITVQTSCTPAPITSRETFDTQGNCIPVCGEPCAINGVWGNNSNDDFDWTVTSGTTQSLGTGPEGDVNGGLGNFIYLETSGSSCNFGKRAILQTECLMLDKQGSDTCHFSFNYHMFGVNVGSLSLEVSVDGGVNWDRIWERIGSQSNQWLKEYISLDLLDDGSIYQLRFIGTGGFGSKGDIALDDLTLYGSTAQGDPAFRYFVDSDDDGYGNGSNGVYSCFPDPPTGFVRDSTDCNDGNPLINPGQDEVPCNGIDDNCNFNVVNDDPVLPPPVVDADTIEICSGESVLLCATPAFSGFIFWYGSPTGPDIEGITNDCFSPNLPPNNDPVDAVYRFYAAESTFICETVDRKEVVVIVHPNPELSSGIPPSICPGDTIDLNSIAIFDANLTGGTITWHSGSPVTEANRIFNTIVSPDESVTYYYRMISENGCSDENGLQVQLKPGPDLTFIPSDTFSLCIESQDTLRIQASGGAGNYAYFWSNGSENNFIPVVADFNAGTVDKYGVTVTDGDGCFSVDTAVIFTTANIDSLIRSVQNVSACNGTDGAISLTPLNGLPPFTYQWSGTGGAGIETGIPGGYVIDNLSQGSYNITITDNSSEACDFVLRSVTVNGPGAIIAEPDITNISCKGANDGAICLNVDGTDPSYSWSTGDSTLCVDNLPPGIYSVTVVDGPCTNTFTDMVISEPPILNLRADLTYPSCFGFNNGEIIVTAFGGTPNYEYEWSTGSASNRLINLGAGTYDLTLTDAKDCQFFESFTIEAPDLLAIQVDSTSNISCLGESDGYIQVQGLGGVAPYQFSWNTGSTSPVLANLSPGNYEVTVTDFQDCTATQSFTITQPSMLELALQSSTPPICIGDENGQITVEAMGGTPGYSFIWDTGDTGPVLSNLGVGEYTVFAVDVNGCRTDSLLVSLTTSSSLDLGVTITAPECIGATDGQITLNPNGLEPFDYAWETGDNTATITNIGVGSFPVTITDAQGCIYDTLVTVFAEQALEISAMENPPQCVGDINGFIEVNILDAGTPPLDYQWNTGQDTRSISNIGPGEYVLTITDALNCELVTDTFHLEEPKPLEMEVDEIGEIFCTDDSTGFIELTISGGEPPYTYLWNGVSSTEDLFKLAAGQYNLLVLDQNMCTIDTSIILTNPQPLEVEVDVDLGDACSGENGNRVEAIVLGGSPPYSYAWSNRDTGGVLINVVPGDYSLTVFDSKGCAQVTNTIKVRESISSVQLDTFVTTDITCHNLDDGTALAAISGGRGPFRYHFSNGYIEVTNKDTVQVESLAFGSYDVTVLDLGTGCFEASDERRINEPFPLSIRQDSTKAISCSGGNDGAIFATGSGGVLPYSFTWLDADNQIIGMGDAIQNLASGTYRGVIEDVNGCTDTLFSIDIAAANPPLALADSIIIKDVNCKGAATGQIDIEIMGGKPPYAYMWDNGRTTQDLNNVVAGTYEVTITDQDTCLLILPNFVVEEPPIGLLVQSITRDLNCFSDTTGRIELVVTGGGGPDYQYTWEYEGQSLDLDGPILENGFAGRYFVAVQDTNNCTIIEEINLTQPSLLSVQLVQDPGPFGEGINVTAVPNGGVPDYGYLWNTGEMTQAIDVFNTGSYSVTVTDDNGCTVEASESVVSVSGIEVVASIELFPNPTSGKSQLNIELTKALNLEVHVYNWLGQVLDTQSFGSLQDLNVRLDLSDQSAGSYWVQILGDGQPIYQAKLMLLKP